jgi:hypothetical protein
MNKKVSQLFILPLLIMTAGFQQGIAQQKKIILQINAPGKQLLYAGNEIKFQLAGEGQFTWIFPPGKSYYREDEITGIPGIISNEFGKGKSVFIPWQIGSLYNFKAHYAYKVLFVSALNNLLKVENSIVTNASPLIEMTRLANPNGAFEWIAESFRSDRRFIT